ncbi:MAG: VWA domain-containing protein [Cellulosilyticaceae bacterium]
MKKILLLILICLLCIPFTSYGREYTNEKEKLDVMFVIDCSGSMGKDNTMSICKDMINMYIDMSLTPNTRVGYVAYNHQINSKFKLTSIENKQLKDELKNNIKDISPEGNTNIGLGLKESVEMLTTDKKPNTQQVIILLSDGETFLGGDAVALKQSQKDLKDATKKAKENSIPIYTISIEKTFEGNIENIVEISNATKGKAYRVKTENDYIKIFNEIFSSYAKSPVVPVAKIQMSGAKEVVKIKIPSKYVEEGKILFQNTGAVDNIQVYYNEGSAAFEYGKNYAVVDLKKPKQEEITITFKGEEGKTSNISVLLNYNLEIVTEIEDSVKKNQNTTFKLALKDKKTGKEIVDQGLYDGLTGRVKIVSKNKEEDVKCIAQKDGLKATYNYKNEGEYKIIATISQNNMVIKSDAIPLIIKNTAPSVIPIEKIVLPVGIGKQTINLNDYFKDDENDSLIFNIGQNPAGISKLTLDEKGNLTIQATRYAEDFYHVEAVDTDGKSVSTTLEVKTISLLMYYYPITLVATVLVIILILAYIINKKMKAPKPYFSGKLTGYFISFSEDEDIPPIEYHLYNHPYKEIISLKQLLPKTVGDENIIFTAGFDKHIGITNKSNYTVMVNNSILEKGKTYTLVYGTKIYVTLKTYEAEIHYKNVLPSEKI